MTNQTKHDRPLVKFLEGTPWAIVPESLDIITSIVHEHLLGNNIAVASSPSAKPRGSINHPSIAVIPIEGTIAKKLYGLEAISGGETTVSIQQTIQQALDDSSITGIVLDIDSPGGTVDGTKELADFIYESRNQKPIVAYTSGSMCSAAYWIGSAASKIVAFDTSRVGSIGVVSVHKDLSVKEEQQGIKTTHIYAGQYKAYGNNSEPLTDLSKAYIQERVDYYYSMFVDSIATHRDVSAEEVISKMAEGKVFIGRQALKVNLIDDVGNIQTAINLAQDLGGNMTVKVEAPKVEEKTPNFEELQASIAALTAKLADSEARAEEQAKEKEALEAKVAMDKKVASVKEKLAECKLSDNEEFISLCAKLDDSDFSTLLSVVSAQHKNVEEAAKAMTKVTPNTTTVKPESNDAPDSIDAAVDHIMASEKIEDVEKATELAIQKYPELFKP